MSTWQWLALPASLALLSCATPAPAQPPPVPPSPEKLGKLDLVLQHFGSSGDANLGALGGKVVLVDFWATWCGPCHAAARGYERLYERFHAQGLEVYGVSLDDDGAPIAEFVTEQGMTYPVLVDPGGKVSGPRFEIDSVPFTVIADRHGKVRFTHEGFVTESEERIQHEIEQLLAEQ